MLTNLGCHSLTMAGVIGRRDALRRDEIPPGTLHLLIFEDVGAGWRNAWVRDRQFHSADIAGRPAGGGGLAVPGVAADADQRLGDREVGHDGGKPPRSVLPTYRCGAQAIRRGNVAV